MESFVRRRNIAQYEALLEREADPARRQILASMLFEWRQQESGPPVDGSGVASDGGAIRAGQAP